VNNESSEIIRMFNSEFNALLPREKAEVDLYPANIAAEIDGLNEWVYDGINSTFVFASDKCVVCVLTVVFVVDGVYKAGFATTQAAYEKAVHLVFQSLDRVEAILGKQEYLVGNTMTEADVRLFTTIVRFFLSASCP
jgi:glutathionyl-hydroquinone reductase